MKSLVFGYFILIVLIVGATHVNAQYSEKYRPQYHFSPAKGWMGDPDGLVVNNGKYHLFWWGHAVSEDLVFWKELPYPMKGGDGNFSYFSGSVIVDKNNTAGFGKNSMIAFYTRHLPGDSLPEAQAISISTDEINFNYYPENPVLDINKIFFRDPQVFWHSKDQKWKMIVALSAEHKIHIYESSDAKKWTFCSEFGEIGAKSAFWECPDLFQVSIKGNPSEKRWMLMIGRGPNRVQYFVGDFDGKKFTTDPETEAYLKSGKGISGRVFQDFEGNITTQGWVIKGDAFKSRKLDSDSSHHLGETYLSSADKKHAVGQVRSPAFRIEKNAINFLLAGADKPEALSIDLLVNGKVVRTTSGQGSGALKWNGWDVSGLVGKTAVIQIKDASTEKEGYLTVDHIIFSDQLWDYKQEHALWMDYGNDFYATRTWRNYDKVQDSVIAIAWMGNWDYAGKVPSSWGKGFQSIPRVFELKRVNGRYRLVQAPVPALQKLRNNFQEKQNQRIDTERSDLFKPKKNVYELELTFKPGNASRFGTDLLVGEGRKLRLVYDTKTAQLCMDRTACTDFTSDSQFASVFATKMKAPVPLQQGLLKLRIFVDQASIEVFANDGEVVLSALTFPSENQLGVSFFSEGGNTFLQSLKAWEMTSIWNKN
ncbi:glycoside hydrolase family 32 protein [Desertivirga brevis]|uniref:glycoside hydrolase family 32 protein n=1 Tax=Desertivirga brevis TaxID=2810310 RepID=UPI001A968F05|nr:GH32 C-terminal domain-containing protein [Pedobacter sp. SYSU D00873]